MCDVVHVWLLSCKVLSKSKTVTKSKPPSTEFNGFGCGAYISFPLAFFFCFLLFVAFGRANDASPTGFCVRSKKRAIKVLFTKVSFCLWSSLPPFRHPCEGRDPEEPQPKHPALCVKSKKRFIAPGCPPARA
jgi:hypothetical protein